MPTPADVQRWKEKQLACSIPDCVCGGRNEGHKTMAQKEEESFSLARSERSANRDIELMGKRVSFDVVLERDTKERSLDDGRTEVVRLWSERKLDEESTGWVTGTRYLQEGVLEPGRMTGGLFDMEPDFEPPYLRRTATHPVYLIARTPYQKPVPVPKAAVREL